MSELRCGVVGLNRGRLFVDVFQNHPHCRVTAVCDSDPKRLAGFSGLATHTDYDAFLAEGLDVVAVVTPGPLHAGQSIRALESGSHVLCETPCVYSVAEARNVVSATQRTGRSYMLAEDYLWRGWVEALKAAADDGAFGRTVYAEGEYIHDCRDIMLADQAGFVPYADRGRRPGAARTWRATHLPPIVYCSHTLGPLLTIMGDRVTSAVGLSTGTHTAPDLDAIDVEAALLETEQGAVIRLTNGFSVACPMVLGFQLVGTAGSVRFVHDGRASARWYSEAAVPRMAGWEDMPAHLLAGRDGRDSVAAMVEQFVASILEDRQPPIDVHRSMDFVLPGIIANESARQGGVKLPVPDSRSWATG
jgi:predicted dehydrogenase